MEGLMEGVDMLKEDITKFDISKHIKQLGPLHRAVVDGDKVKLEEMLRHGEDGDDEDGTPFNYTTAHWAAMKSDDDILELLNDFGTNMSAVDETDMRPLHVAALAGNSVALMWLLENTYDIESTDIYEQTPLHLAALNGRLQAVKILVEHGASMEATDEFGMTPICIAAARGFSHVVHFLLQKGANPVVQDIDGKTLLHASSAVDDVATIVCLLKKRIDPNAKDNMNCTPLHDAAKNGCCKSICELLKNGADKNVTDLDGCTPFYRAKEAGHLKTIALLADKEEDEMAFVEVNVEVTEYNNSQIDSTTNYLEPNINNGHSITPMESSDKKDNCDDLESNFVIDREIVAINSYCNNACTYVKDNEIANDDESEDEEGFKLDFSVLTTDDINKIIF
ncbi:ankyrin repeat, PH and SEC7 domain containing protein secG-like [Halyomorpha halys]|uniref:ankyrin repeat, PH and SEC7 domain containing protein secG-like n=1 Tax=Halyomorpha halys TaxID=286706 RepID=UPI0006D5101E|nr:inversin-like [Halyomorpha halys]